MHLSLNLQLPALVYIRGPDGKTWRIIPPSNEWYAVSECAEQAVDGSLHSGEIEESISKGLNQLTVGKFRAPGLRQALFAIEGTC